MEKELRQFELPGAGLKCAAKTGKDEVCGATLPSVYRTLTTAAFVTRHRICPKCKTVNITSERVIGTRDKCYMHEGSE